PYHLLFRLPGRRNSATGSVEQIGAWHGVEQPMTTAHVGQPVNRVDGRAKVTGQAKYAAEYHVPDLAHGVVVCSTIARGRITTIDAGAALKLPGVLQVFTHENAPS